MCVCIYIYNIFGFHKKKGGLRGEIDDMLNIVPSLLCLFSFIAGNGGVCGNEKTDGAATTTGFVGRNGTHFVVRGERMYLNGFNAYWMMNAAADTASRTTVTAALRQASAVGMNVARTWGFHEGGYEPLQISPGSYNEHVFQGLDFVVYEAGKYNIKLIISLANNYDDFGGRSKYVEWASLEDPDEFYTDPLVMQFYKSHVKTMLTRKNTITGVMYKDDPTIFAWELINEPRCNDPSGSTLQEMAAYVKSIDSNHLLEVGLEGFYGKSRPERMIYNPNTGITGSDFLSNNLIPDIDFATIHIYPDSWLPQQTDQIGFVDKWVRAHIHDCDTLLKKPLVIAEFGKSSMASGFSLDKRNMFFRRIYRMIYESARAGSSGAGGIFWQLSTRGTGKLGDGYEVFLEEGSSTARVIADQSTKLSSLMFRTTLNSL
ncbi:PREDICTED: mannan endo-1,4-beta-mannosidase 1 isoform X2 [Tarenaya hassleriana]|uniref:mannan endo-1,4-beta-mannosidase 1 isoform X2 n=1 Tax=Tarenaya hassleriana TaxID=28532 RepID=UPI00053CA0EB|nr:PREDICTED: mannan endo-1,4-beta-mannosidase 1 isoform X2 [Tarenaya hassleriana]